MAAAALVRSDRLDKPSLMLAGQPEKEVRGIARLRVGSLSRPVVDYENWFTPTAL